LAVTALRLAGDSGDKTIRMIDRDGLDRAEGVANSGVGLYQFLPLYDLSHLGGVVVKGYLPTRGEFVWAGVDAALIAVDVLSVVTLQPEGVAASEAARSGIKTAARASVKSSTRAVVEKVTEGVAEHAASATTRQLARNTSEQLAEQVASLSVRSAESASAELAESLARRSGIQLARSSSAAAGRGVLSHVTGLPRNRLAKYVVANGAQAAVGLVAVRKMEEYLAGRAGQSRSEGDRS
jgi:hypothetical protein